MNRNHIILLVEDNEDDVFLMQRALKGAGIVNRLRIVDDGQQAIDYLAGKGTYTDREAHPFPAIVFLDLSAQLGCAPGRFFFLRRHRCTIFSRNRSAITQRIAVSSRTAKTVKDLT